MNVANTCCIFVLPRPKPADRENEYIAKQMIFIVQQHKVFPEAYLCILFFKNKS